jgi:Ala-tRNA(Pro) deacylase
MLLKEFLKKRRVHFEVIPHRDTYDAQRMAATIHVSGHAVAKTVLLRADRGYRFIVAVLPANKAVDMTRLSRFLGGSRLELATEEEIAQHCADCELGALPPFGSQYAMKTIMDESLLDEDELVFEGNNHHEAIRMKMQDFREIEQPLVADFAR